MADIGELIGTVMAGLARARQMADQETIRIAREYQTLKNEEPLLEGLSIPRIRIPEITMDIPMLIESQETEQAASIANTPTLLTNLQRDILKTAELKKINLPSTVAQGFAKELNTKIALLQKDPEKMKTLSKETVAVLAAESLGNQIKRSRTASVISPAQQKLLLTSVQKRALQITEIKPAHSGRLGASILTNDIKEKSAPETVTRIKITLREEGLEWVTIPNEDSTKTTSRLMPE